MVFNMVLRSKMLHGLETIQLARRAERTLNTFQLKDIRKILHRLTTYGKMQRGEQKTNTTEAILAEANEVRTFNDPDATQFARLSNYHKHQKKSLSVKLIRMSQSDPRKAVAYVNDNLATHDYGKKRVGGQRLQWVKKVRDGF